jgi:conjugal transfer pilus assembly protein TraD
LANGGYTELKDKIISLKDEWSSDYYRSIAEDYLQTTLEVLIKSKNTFDLRAVVNCLNYGELTTLARKSENPDLMKRVASLEHYDRKDITGLQAHLNILIHSELGQFFEKNDTTFTLSEAIDQNAVVYFALPALRFPSFSKVLGKLVINDLKAVIDRNPTAGKPMFAVFDEFSVFAGEQVLNLVNMGRGKGVHAIFGTQGLADLDKVDVTFKNQVLNCVNTLICHRLNDDDSASSVASWVGTQDTFNVTAQINMKEGDAAMGTVKSNKEFIVHPDEIKQGLQTGEAFYITKVGKFRKDKIKVKFM